ncbi:MAG: M20 family metallopeptidase [Candidatus Bathyarchaeia archaeon]
MIALIRQIAECVEKRRDEAISLLQHMIRIPSLSTQEEHLSKLVMEKMYSSGFDSIKLDRLNDVMGTIKGSGGGRSLLLNGHLDHVPPGEMLDPYSGKILDGSIFGVSGKVVYGRGASDMKGALAAMIMAGAILKDLGLDLKGDFKIAAVVQEEVGGVGTIATIEESQFLGDLVIVGEATNMNLSLGHRGGAGTSIVVRGVSSHASAPERGVNALYKALDIILKIKDDLIPRLPEHPIFGKTTLAVTRIEVKPNTSNVIPEECRFYIDCRNGPDYPAERLKDEIEAIIRSLKENDQDLEAIVLPSNILKGVRSFTGFYTNPADQPIVREVKETLNAILGREVKETVWRFATDGRFYHYLGYPVLGFGPCEERFAHTNQDHIRIEEYLDSIKVYTSLACKICGLK